MACFSSTVQVDSSVGLNNHNPVQAVISVRGYFRFRWGELKTKILGHLQLTSTELTMVSYARGQFARRLRRDFAGV